MDRINIDEYIESLITVVEEALEDEKDDYKIAILKRMKTNSEAVGHLVRGEFQADALALTRVGFEHASRLLLYQKDPEAITKNPKHKTAFKLLGAGPTPNLIMPYIGGDFKVIYQILCAFAHPDVLSLSVNMSQTDGEKRGCEVMIALTLISNIYLLSEAYPGILKEEQIDNIMNELLSLATFSGDLFNLLFTNSPLLETMIPYLASEKLFKVERFNEMLTELAMSHTNEEEAKAYIDNQIEQLKNIILTR